LSYEPFRPAASYNIGMFLIFLTLVLALPAAAVPVPVIFDTDIGNDIDDALALAMLHALESRGEVRLLAVTITKDCRAAAPFVDLVNHFYGRPGIPVGVVRGGKTPGDTPMIQLPVDRRRPSGEFVYPRRLAAGADAPAAAGVLRQVLESQPDGSVVIIQVGFSTNLARLLEAPGGRQLAARKVRLVSLMGGAFPAGQPEYNIKMDIPSAQRVFAEWPSPIVASGFEIGESILYPASSIEKDFAYVPDHPIAEAYRAYQKMPYDRPTWDLTSVLYAARPRGKYFGLSAPGRIVVDDEGRTRLEPQRRGPHRFLTVSAAQRKRVLATFIELASQPPSRR
jgi:inosine-uridine nucleoside N-ribohydrolase